MDIEANKAIVRKYLELWDTGNLALADEVLAPHFVDHLHPELAPGPESVKKEVAAFRAAFRSEWNKIRPQELIERLDLRRL